MQKKERQNALLSLIGRFSIASQGELASRLSEQGYSVTQASVSRDLVEVRVVKSDGYYSLAPKTSRESEFDSVTLDTAGETLIVCSCSSGLASAITVKIDAARIPEIVGTIAGDDTIFIAVKDVVAQRTALKKISEMFG